MAPKSLLAVYYANLTRNAFVSSFSSRTDSLSPRLDDEDEEANFDSRIIMRQILSKTTRAPSDLSLSLTEESSELSSSDNETFLDEGGGQDMMDLPPSLLVSFTVILATLLIIGVVGNILVILVLVKAHFQERRSLVATTSTTNAYILNLSAADLLFLVFCAPFHGTVYILNHWPFGWAMCKLAHYCQFCTVYASIWILTTMSVDRYVAIGHPLKSVKWRHPTQATKISAVMWVSAALVSVPWLILYETDEYSTDDGSTRVACYDAWSDSTYHYRKWMILFGFLIGFLIPSVVIFCMALLIAKSIRLATHQPLLSNGNDGGTWMKSDGDNVGGGLRRRRRVGWLVFALSLVFFICWGPHNVSLVWLNFDSTALDWINEHYQAFFILKLVAHMMTYLNSSVNPLLYSVGSNQFFRRLVSTCGLSSRSPSGNNTSCRTFANRTLHADSVLIHFPVSRSSSAVIFTKKSSTSSLGVTRPAKPEPNPRKLTVTASNASTIPRRSPIIPTLVAAPKSLTRLQRHHQLLAPNRKSSSSSACHILTNRNALDLSPKLDAVPLISKRLDEVKRMQQKGYNAVSNNLSASPNVVVNSKNGNASVLKA